MKKVIDTEVVKRMYAEGHSLRSIGKVVGASHVHVWRILTELGVEIRDSRGYLPPEDPIDLDGIRAEVIRILESGGLKETQIAKVLRLSVKTVRRLRESENEPVESADTQADAAHEAGAEGAE